MDKEIKIAQDKLTAQRNVSGKTLQLSHRDSGTELKASIAQLMAKTKIRLPNPPLTQLQSTAYQEDWERLAMEFGTVQFRRAIESLWTKKTFFPVPGEIRAELENMEPPPDPAIPEYRHFEKPNDPITQEEFSVMLDEYPILNKWRDK